MNKLAVVGTLAVGIGAAAAAFASAAQQLPTNSPVSIGGVNDDAERTSFDALLKSAYETLQSKRFHDNLKALGATYPAIYVHYVGSGVGTDHRTAVTQTVDQLSTVSAARAPYRYVRSPAALVGSSDDRTAHAGWTGSPGQLGSMSIGRFHVGRWQSSDLVERSCAINTVAHELTHLISNQSPLYMMHLTDSNAATLTSKDKDGKPIVPALPVGTYLLGSVAQCTWLQESGYVPAVDIKTCVAIFGHRGFNSDRCQSFSNGRTIAVRDDLPAEHVIFD